MSLHHRIQQIIVIESWGPFDQGVEQCIIGLSKIKQLNLAYNLAYWYLHALKGYNRVAECVYVCTYLNIYALCFDQPYKGLKI